MIKLILCNPSQNQRKVNLKAHKSYKAQLLYIYSLSLHSTQVSCCFIQNHNLRPAHKTKRHK